MKKETLDSIFKICAYFVFVTLLDKGGYSDTKIIIFGILPLFFILLYPILKKFGDD